MSLKVYDNAADKQRAYRARYLLRERYERDRIVIKVSLFCFFCFSVFLNTMT